MEFTEDDLCLGIWPCNGGLSIRGLGVVLGKISGLMGLLLSPKNVDDIVIWFCGKSETGIFCHGVLQPCYSEAVCCAVWNKKNCQINVWPVCQVQKKKWVGGKKLKFRCQIWLLAKEKYRVVSRQPLYIFWENRRVGCKHSTKLFPR